MRYLCLAILITGSAALSGCFGDSNDNNFDSKDKVDQNDAELAVQRASTVISASKNVNIDEPQDIDRIILPEANLAEPVAITGANASL